ncbi:hypothetical protein [Sphingobium abikonense]|uniref:hypothetical protein n=1 Tax=Sphingobium abikonense TaxID=86193 RepID=UPI003515603C
MTTTPSARAREAAKRETHIIDGVCFVLPKYEGAPLWAKKLGCFGIGFNLRWSSFNIGVDVLEAGFLVAFGPCYLWIAHIERQQRAFARATAIRENRP